jgi:predicted metal-binding protein
MRKTDRLGKYIASAKRLGARDAKVIPARGVRIGDWVRLKCKFGCGGYGRRLCCPPNSPAPGETREMLKGYSRALLVHSTKQEKIGTMVAALEREIFLDGFYKAFAMGAGPCRLCAECAEFCRHPAQARPAMEACGIDVYATVRGAGFPINVVKSRDCGQDYYGLVLIE